MISVTVDTAAVRKLLARYQEPELGKKARAAMNESLAYLESEVVDRTPVDTGIARGSIFTQVRGTALANMTGRVAGGASSSKYLEVLEHGRKPGRMPPVEIIERWASRHGMAGRGFLIARAIGRRGLKGHHMFELTAKGAGGVVERIWLRWFRRI